jgi:copper resistance protein B
MASPAKAQDHAAHTQQDRHSPQWAEPSADAPSDHAADLYFDPDDMARARRQLLIENGGMPTRAFFIDQLELGADDNHETYAWDMQGWRGGDIHRFWWKSEGEGDLDSEIDYAELQLLYSRAVTPYFDLQAGVRQSYRPEGDRTDLVVGIQGLAPYWFEVSAETFVSNKGEITARAEAEYDLRLTQRLILQPSAELSLSAQDVPEFSIASGITALELGARLRYELRRDFAPYIGVEWESAIGATRDIVEAQAEDTDTARFVIGLRAFF